MQSYITEKQKQEFIIKDNLGFGDWDWDILANEWDSVELEDWGLDVWLNEDDIYNNLDEEETEPQAKDQNTYVPCVANNNEIQHLCKIEQRKVR